ncbi:imidazole glycerol phosphate synthase subunit HisH [Larkinella sp. GY13]|uniref:imidazole glycerol phosphate synthase subunit HisH n=1 Tax=Larkinella sp. GY13 TaxID=3453720 RepID=UPI003EF03E4B
MNLQTGIVIIDYGMGNLRSVQKKFECLHRQVCISSDIRVIAKADKLVLPGVGHFANGVRKLKESGIWDVMNHKVLVEKTPILGICLGMQLMARHSEEGDVEGLGWFDAEVVRFRMENERRYKVPHMGWNTARVTKESTIFNDIPEDTLFYFVHSYYVACNEKRDVLAMTRYECSFASAIAKDNIYGMQFHPEKSHDWGAVLIENFIGI